MLALYQTIMLLLNVAQFIVIVHIIMSWLLNFGVLNPRQPLVAQIWQGLSALLEPIYSRVRRILPQTGALDLAPLVVFIGIMIAQFVVQDIFF